MNLAFLYRRVSTDHQDNSLSMQDALQAEYCRRLDYEVRATHEDDDVSGSIPMRDRPGGSILLRTIEYAAKSSPTGTVHLITAKQDRLGRDTLDQIATIRWLWELGVTPHLVAEGGALPRNPQSELLFEIKASVAQYERNLIRQRTQAVLDHKRSLGELVGSVPYGADAEYTFADGHVFTSNHSLTATELAPLIVMHGPCRAKLLIPNPDEEAVLRRIVPLRYPSWPEAVICPGRSWSLKQIYTMLNLEGIPTKHASPARTGLWGPGNLDGVLQSKHTRLLLAGPARTSRNSETHEAEAA